MNDPCTFEADAIRETVAQLHRSVVETRRQIDRTRALIADTLETLKHLPEPLLKPLPDADETARQRPSGSPRE